MRYFDPSQMNYQLNIQLNDAIGIDQNILGFMLPYETEETKIRNLILKEKFWSKV